MFSGIMKWPRLGSSKPAFEKIGRYAKNGSGSLNVVLANLCLPDKVVPIKVSKYSLT